MAFQTPSLDELTLIKSCKSTKTSIPVVDLSSQNSKNLIAKACEEYGFFKISNHGIPIYIIDTLENEAMRFFSLEPSEKEKIIHPNPLVYRNTRIGNKGDMGWLEYLLMPCKSELFVNEIFPKSLGKSREHFCVALRDYISAMRILACKVLELLAEGLHIKPKDMFTKILMDENSNSYFRINHYPPCPEIKNRIGFDLVGFGEHTDPQIISVLRSNKVEGLQILLKDGNWVTVPPDPNNLFFIVGDSLQVMTNGRLKSVKHRVLANDSQFRMSMIYFGGPPLHEKIKPLKSIMEESEKSLYKEFTWEEYMKSATMTKLADNRLKLFEKEGCSYSY